VNGTLFVGREGCRRELADATDNSKESDESKETDVVVMCRTRITVFRSTASRIFLITQLLKGKQF
jgi:hypothetical protein